jgi:hypothetical protein
MIFLASLLSGISFVPDVVDCMNATVWAKAK